MVGGQLRDQQAPRIAVAAPGPAGGVRKETSRQRPGGRRRPGGDDDANKSVPQHSESDGGKEVEEGSVDDVGAEYIENAYYVASAEEETVLYQRLYKKRSNMALALYHKNHPDSQYQFLRVRLNDIFNFMEYRLQHPFNTHMNFMALDVNTGLEKLFFAELCMINDCNDGNSGYVAVTCEIVDDNSAGGRKDKGFFPDGKYPPDYYDGENCYACSERIKHPPAASYRAGHDVFGYGYD